jgi:hypothetical protein
MKIKSLILNWGEYLKPYIDYLEIDKTKLSKLPLSSKLDTTNKDILSKYYIKVIKK